MNRNRPVECFYTTIIRSPIKKYSWNINLGSYAMGFRYFTFERSTTMLVCLKHREYHPRLQQRQQLTEVMFLTAPGVECGNCLWGNGYQYATEMDHDSLVHSIIKYRHYVSMYEMRQCPSAKD